MNPPPQLKFKVTGKEISKRSKARLFLFLLSCLGLLEDQFAYGKLITIIIDRGHLMRAYGHKLPANFPIQGPYGGEGSVRIGYGPRLYQIADVREHTTHHDAKPDLLIGLETLFGNMVTSGPAIPAAMATESCAPLNHATGAALLRTERKKAAPRIAEILVSLALFFIYVPPPKNF